MMVMMMHHVMTVMMTVTAVYISCGTSRLWMGIGEDGNVDVDGVNDVVMHLLLLLLLGTLFDDEDEDDAVVGDGMRNAWHESPS